MPRKCFEARLFWSGLCQGVCVCVCVCHLGTHVVPFDRTTGSLERHTGFSQPPLQPVMMNKSLSRETRESCQRRTRSPETEQINDLQEVKLYRETRR